ncbi:hypothetical protein RB213_013614 [Colletotrichum asianum]
MALRKPIDLRKRCAQLPYYLLQHVDRIDAEWWFDRHRQHDNAQSAMDVLKTSVEMFDQARHITLTPCLPLMSAAKTGNTPDIEKGKYSLRNPWIEPDEIAIAKLRQWKRYLNVQDVLWDFYSNRPWTVFFARSKLEIYVTKSFPLPIFELVFTNKRAEALIFSLPVASNQ